MNIGGIGNVQRDPASEDVGDADLTSPEFFDALSLIGHVLPGQDVVWDEQQRVWLAGSYEAFKEIAAQPETFQFPGADAEFAPAWLDRDFYVWYEGGPKKFNFVQGEEHDRLHRWWMRQFSPRQIANWRDEVIRPHVDRLIDEFVDERRADLVRQFAREIPLPIILRMMEIPVDDELVGRYNRVAHEFGQIRWAMLSGPDVPDDLLERAALVSEEMRDILMPYLRERRHGAGDDLISALWRASPDLIEGEVDDDAVYANVTTLFEAGIGTGAAAIGEVLFLLCKSEEHQSLLRRQPELIPNYVEEALRLTTPALYIPRQVTRDLVFRGCRMRRGDTVYAVGLTAGRDPDHYPHPDSIDLARDAPRDHVAFGFGPRSCAGHAVGRAELQETVAAVVTRLRGLRVDSSREAPARVGAGPRRPWGSLHVTFERS